MALIDCRECGATISDQARACPQCGAPTAEPKGVNPIVFTIGLGLLLAGAWIGTTGVRLGGVIGLGVAITGGAVTALGVALVGFNIMRARRASEPKEA